MQTAKQNRVNQMPTSKDPAAAESGHELVGVKDHRAVQQDPSLGRKHLFRFFAKP